MATKRAQEAASPAPRASKSKGAKATPKRRSSSSEEQAPRLNDKGVYVDANGVAVTFKKLKEAEDEKAFEVIGELADSPAKLLKAVALDPRVNLAVRIDAAKAAAPYFDRKQPTSVDGGVDPETGKPVPLGSDMKMAEKVGKLTDDELKTLMQLAKRMGLDLSSAV